MSPPAGPISHGNSHTSSRPSQTTADPTITTWVLVDLDRDGETVPRTRNSAQASVGERVKPDRELMTVQDVARYLRVPVGTLHNWRVTGDGPPAARIGRHVRYRRADVESWVAERVRMDAAQRGNGR